MAFRLNKYQEQPGAVLESNRYQVGKTLQRLQERRDLPFFIRDIRTDEVVEVITEQSVENFGDELRRVFHLERFVGVQKIAEEAEEI